MSSTAKPTVAKNIAEGAISSGSLSYRALEPRVVFDGAGAALIASVLHGVDKTVDAHRAAAGADAAHATADLQHDALVASLRTVADTMAARTAATQFVFIENNLPDIATLLKGVPANAQVVMLESTKDGMDQIAAYLAGRSNVGAIHIISHGAVGEVDLGTAKLTTASLATTYAADIATIKAALAPNADILLYGCDVAKGSAGDAFVHALAKATGDNIAASTDLTGAASLGGDWVLEDKVGSIHTAAIDAKDWYGELTTNVSNGKGALLSATGGGIYSIDIGTGKATLVTTVPGSVGGIAMSGTINSFAVDQADGLIYYCDNAVTSANTALFAYDFVHNQHILISSDVTKFGVNVGSVGLGASGATWANGKLFLGVDNPSGTEDLIYVFSFTNSGKTINSATNLNVSLPLTNDWGDLGYDSVNNTLLSFSAPNLSMTRIDPVTGVVLGSFILPSGSGYQGSQDQAGNVYTLGGSLLQVDPLNGAAIGSALLVTTDGSTALGGSNDAGGWTPPTATLGGQVFLDVNANTTKDASEPTFANVTVQLYTDVNNNGVIDGKDSLIGTDTTGANGQYQFTGVLPGNYIVKVNDANGVITGRTYTTGTNINSSADVSLIGAQALNVNFGVNEAAPVLDLDTSSSGAGYVTTFTKLGAPVSVGKIGATGVTDTDSPDMASASIVLTNAQANDTLAIGTLPAGITSSLDTSVAGRITVTLTGMATQADYQTAIDAVTFSNASVTLSNVDRTIQATVNDGYKDSAVATATIHISAPNIAPVEVVPGAQSIDVNTSTAIAGLSVSDIDANGGLETVTLSVSHGTLSLANKTGLTFTTGTGTGDTTTVFKGTLTDINNDLAGLTYKSNANYTGAETLTFTTNDNGNTGTGGALSATKSVAITDIDVPPVAQNDTFTTGFNVPVTISELGNDSSPVSLPLTVTKIGATAISGGGSVAIDHGSVALTTAGTLVYTPTAGYSGAETFTYTISDGHGGTATANVTGTVYAAPTPTNDSFTTLENNAVSIPVLANDTDPNSLALTVTKVGSTSITAGGAAVAVTDGSVKLDTLGNLIFIPTTGYTGAVPAFTYTVADSAGGSAMATVTGTVFGPPIVDLNSAATTTDTSRANAVTFTEGGAPLKIATATAAVGDLGQGDITALTIVEGGVKDGAAEIVTIAGNAFPSGTDNTQTATVGGLSVQIAYVAATATFTITNATDPTKAIAAADLSTLVEGITYQNSTNNPTNGTRTLTFTATNTEGLSSTAAVATITDVAVNNPPVEVVPAAQTTNANAPIALPGLSVSDVDANGGLETVTLSVTNGTISLASKTGLTFTTGTGTNDATMVFKGTLADINADLAGLTYKPTANYVGAALLTVTTNDNGNTGTGGALSSGAKTVAITVVDVPPMATDDTFAAMAAGKTATILPLANDTSPIGLPLSITQVDGKAITAGGAAITLADGHGTVSLSTAGALIYSSNLTAKGTETFTYSISDGHGGTASANVSGAIYAPPVATNDTFTTALNTPVTIPVVGNDTDVNGFPLTVTKVGATAITSGGPGVAVTGGVVTLDASNNLIFTPNVGYFGTPSFTYTVDDGHGGTAVATVNGAVWAAPKLASDTFSTSQDLSVAISPLANDTDPNGFALSITQVNGQPITTGGTPVTIDHGTVALTTGGQFIYTPAANYTGPEGFTYTVDDGHGGTATATVSGPVYGPPVASNDTFTTHTGSPAIVAELANDTDPNGFALSVTDVNGTLITASGASVPVTGGSVALNPAGNLVFTPNAGFVGPASFAYGVTDGHGGTSSATVTGNIYALPVATNDTFVVASGVKAVIPVLGNDTDASNLPLSVTAVNGTAIAAGGSVFVVGGTVSLDSAGNLTFTPNTGYLGKPSFNYSITDGQGATSTALVTGTITPPPPVAVNDTFTVQAGSPAVIAVLSNDSDAAGYPLSVTQVNGSAITAGGAAVAVTGGSITANAAGTLTFTPTAGYTGTPSFTYTIDDGHGGTATATVHGTVWAPFDHTPRVDLSGETHWTGATLYGHGPDAIGQPLAGKAVFSADNVIATAGDEMPGAGLAISYASGQHADVSGSAATDLTSAVNGNDYISMSFTTSATAPPQWITAFTKRNTFGTPYQYAVAISTDGFQTGTLLAKDVASDVTSGTLYAPLYPVIDATNFALQPGKTYEVRAYVYNVSGGAAATINWDDFYTFHGNDPTGYSTTFTENGAAVAIANTTLTPYGDGTIAQSAAKIEDAGAANVVSGVVTLTNEKSGDVVSIGGTAVGNGAAGTINGIAYTVADTGNTLIVNLAGSASKAAYSSALQAITFSNTSANPDATDRLVNVTVNDGTSASNTAVATIHVVPVDDAPVETAPATVGTAAGAPVAVSGLSVSDVDANGGPETVTLSAGHGNLSLGSTSGLTFTAGADNGSSTVTFTGTLADLNAALATTTYNPVAGYSGTDMVTFATNDNGNTGIGGPLTTKASISLTVWAPPAPTDDHFVTPANTAVAINALANDSDPNGFPLSITQVNGTAIDATHPVTLADGSGTVALNPNGSLTFTPSSSYTGQPSFLYTVADQHGGTAQATVSGNVLPDATARPFTTPEDISPPAITGVSALPGLTITKINGQPIDATHPVTLPDGSGVVSLNPNGSLTFTPATGYAGTPSFTYTATDPFGDTATATVPGSVTDVPPTPADDHFLTPANTPVVIPVLANDTAVAGNTLAVTQINGQAIDTTHPVTLADGSGQPIGTVALNPTGSVTFTPQAGYTGQPSFLYTVADQHGGTATAMVSGSVLPPAAPFTTPEGITPAPITGVSALPGLTITEVNGQPIDPTHPVILTDGSGTVSLNPNGSLTFKPSTGYAGTPSFTYTASDPFGKTATTPVPGTVTDVPPTPANDHFLTPANTAVMIPVLANDTAVAGNALTVTQINGSAIDATHPVTLADGSGVVALNPNGSLTYTPQAGYVGQPSFQYTVADQHGGTAQATVSGSDLLDSTAKPFTTPEDITPSAITGVSALPGLTITKINGQPIDPTHPVTLTDGSGTVALNPNGSLTFKPSTGYAGTPSFTYTATDPYGDTATTSVPGTVTDVPPTPANDHFLTPADTPVVIAVLANDTSVAGNTLTVIQINGTAIDARHPVSLADGSGVVALNPNGSVTFTPQAGYTGQPSFQYTVSDQHGGTALGTVKGDVVAPPPLLKPASVLIPNLVDTRTTALDVLPVEGAVSAAVNGTFDSSGGPLLQKATVPALGGSPSGVSGHSLIHDMVSWIKSLWTAPDAAASIDGIGGWNPVTMIGSSLRIGVAADNSNPDADNRFMVESSVHDGVLTLNFEERRRNSTGPHIVDYRVSQADGRVLPAWMERPSVDVVQGRRSADADDIDLKIDAIYSDGTQVTETIRVHAATGVIEVLPGHRAELMPKMFSQQFAAYGNLSGKQTDALAAALAE